MRKQWEEHKREEQERLDRIEHDKRAAAAASYYDEEYYTRIDTPFLGEYNSEYGLTHYVNDCIEKIIELQNNTVYKSDFCYRCECMIEVIWYLFFMYNNNRNKLYIDLVKKIYNALEQNDVYYSGGIYDDGCLFYRLIKKYEHSEEMYYYNMSEHDTMKIQNQYNIKNEEYKHKKELREVNETISKECQKYHTIFEGSKYEFSKNQTIEETIEAIWGMLSFTNNKSNKYIAKKVYEYVKTHDHKYTGDVFEHGMASKVVSADSTFRILYEKARAGHYDAEKERYVYDNPNLNWPSPIWTGEIPDIFD